MVITLSLLDGRLLHGIARPAESLKIVQIRLFGAIRRLHSDRSDVLEEGARAEHRAGHGRCEKCASLGLLDETKQHSWLQSQRGRELFSRASNRDGDVSPN